MKNNAKKWNRIGIMTMHRIVNYGSFLQAYSLKKMIDEIYHSGRTSFIDYKYEGTIIDSKKKKNLIARMLKHRNLYSFAKLKIHQKAFADSYRKYLESIDVYERKDCSVKLDTLIIGSDEVFNCMQGYPVGYSRGLFGKGYEKSNVVSYAASFGHTKYDELTEKGIADEVASMLSRFKAISVRDKNSEKVVKNLLPGRKIYRHLDPVLVGDFDDVMDRPVKYNNYIIVYAYSGRLNKEEEKEIRRFAKRYNKKIVSLGFYQKCADYNLIVEPLDVLAYFKNADFVITDTFHGSVFSIKANTKFCTIIRDSNRNKLISLLTDLHCESQIAEDVDDIDEVYRKKIDFNETNDIIKRETQRSKEYLEENV